MIGIIELTVNDACGIACVVSVGVDVAMYSGGGCGCCIQRCLGTALALSMDKCDAHGSVPDGSSVWMMPGGWLVVMNWPLEFEDCQGGRTAAACHDCSHTQRETTPD